MNSPPLSNKYRRGNINSETQRPLLASEIENNGLEYTLSDRRNDRRNDDSLNYNDEIGEHIRGSDLMTSDPLKISGTDENSGDNRNSQNTTSTGKNIPEVMDKNELVQMASQAISADVYKSLEDVQEIQIMDTEAHTDVQQSSGFNSDVPEYQNANIINE